jgi:benzodiazapine receptor
MIGDIPERWIIVAIAAAWVTIVAVLGGLLTEVGEWYENLTFPSWRPPNWLFGPAWTLIFLLTASSCVIAWERAPDSQSRTTFLFLLILNSILNVIWSGLFFKLRRPDWAFAEIIAFWFSILALLAFVAGVSRTAALLMLPYLLWVTFAGFLNLRMVQLNRPFTGRS